MKYIIIALLATLSNISFAAPFEQHPLVKMGVYSKSDMADKCIILEYDAKQIYNASKRAHIHSREWDKYYMGEYQMFSRGTKDSYVIFVYMISPWFQYLKEFKPYKDCMLIGLAFRDFKGDGK